MVVKTFYQVVELHEDAKDVADERRYCEYGFSPVGKAVEHMFEQQLKDFVLVRSLGDEMYTFVHKNTRSGISTTWILPSRLGRVPEGVRAERRRRQRHRGRRGCPS